MKLGKDCKHFVVVDPEHLHHTGLCGRSDRLSSVDNKPIHWCAGLRGDVNSNIVPDDCWVAKNE